MRKLRKGDQVIVIAGKDKGKTGEILKIVTDTKRGRRRERVMVSGINKVKKHVRSDSERQQEGGIFEREAPLAISNVAISHNGKADRVGFKFLEDGRKVRIYRSDQEMIDV